MFSQPTFDEIYVISDIHMGGQPGFQILGQVERLGRFITHLAGVRPEERVALVLNGDVIDSLAEDIGGRYVATRDAASMMERIYKNFEPVWNGLETFVRTPGRQLVIVTGNHDIEFALPEVEHSVRQRLAGDDPSWNGAITFATHGSGFACRVGNARVYCTHGNEVDSWNVVDYDKLAELANALNAGRDIDHSEWQPNAGTRLVVDLMNKVKVRHPFVDLLKPETQAALPILLVLEPDLVTGIDFRAALKVGWEKRKGNRVIDGLLSADAEDESEIDPGVASQLALDELLGSELQSYVAQPAADSDPDALLLEAESALRGDVSGVPSDEGEGETLGWVKMAVDRVRGVDKTEALRRALVDWLKGDETFDLTHADETYDAVVARTDPSVDFIVTGHTHLQRAIAVGDGRFYYNCGTWIRLIRLKEQLLKEDTFPEVVSALKAGSMEALDAAKIGQESLIFDQTAAVRIGTEQGGSVIGQLLRIDDGEGEKMLNAIDGSEFRKP